VDDLRAAGERQVSDSRTTRGQADSRLARAARARDQTGRRFRRPALALAIAGALSADSCHSPAPAPPSSGPVTLTIGVPQSRQIDPSHGAPLLADTIAFERLTANDAEGRTQPRLLESWSVSADGLTWRLRVRSGVSFQDGSPLTAADVARTIGGAASDATALATSVCLPHVAAARAVGDREVEVRLDRRCSYLLDDLDRAVIRTAADGTTRIGTGAFSIVSSTENAIVMEANRSYYLGAPAIDRVVIRPFDALRTAWAEMMRGRVDFLWEVAPDAAEFLRDQRAVEARWFPGYYAHAVVLNSARPAFRQAAVRRALDAAIDRAALVQQGLKGRGTPADGPVWPRYWARDRRAQAPAPARQDGPAFGGGARAGRLEFTCLVPANFTILERMALLVQQQLDAFDVRVRLESLPPDAFNRRIVSGDFDAAMLSVLGGPSATVFHRFWHSPEGSRRWNYWSYRDARVDAALDAALDAQDDETFARAIAAFQSAWRDNPPAIFLAWNDTAQAVSRRFSLPAGSEGRDAIYVLSRWQPGPPGAREP